MIKNFISPIDGCNFEYFITTNVDSNKKTLSYRIEGTDWQDFIPNDRCYTPEQNKEFLCLLNEVA